MGDNDADPVAQGDSGTGRGQPPFRSRLAGYLVLALIILAIVVFVWFVRQYSPSSWPAGWQILALVVIVAGIFAIVRLQDIQRRLRAQDAREVMEMDLRPPILYLRSFSDDQDSTSDERDEDILKKIVNNVGPFVAIGRPGERLQTPGADRMYVGDEWQEVVSDLMRRSRLIIIRIGESGGLLWEVAYVLSHVEPPQVVLFLPRGRNEERRAVVYRGFRERMAQILSTELPESLGSATVIRFRAGWVPVLVRIRRRGALEKFYQSFGTNRALLADYHEALSPAFAEVGSTLPPLPWWDRYSEHIAYSYLIVLFVLSGVAAYSAIVDPVERVTNIFVGVLTLGWGVITICRHIRDRRRS